jgi:hypothetical protein
MLLREFEWIRDEITEARHDIRRVQTAHAVAFVAVFGWVVGRAFASSGAVSAQQVDAALTLARTRADVALPLCGLAVLNMAYVLLVNKPRARHLALYCRLVDLAKRLQFDGWWIFAPSDVSPHFQVRFWGRSASGAVALTAYALTAGSLWYCRPAARESTAIAVSWWGAIALTVAVFATAALFVFRIKAARIVERLERTLAESTPGAQPSGEDAATSSRSRDP